MTLLSILRIDPQVNVRNSLASGIYSYGIKRLMHSDLSGRPGRMPLIAVAKQGYPVKRIRKEPAHDIRFGVP
jgi:hypothetical protein